MPANLEADKPAGMRQQRLAVPNAETCAFQARRAAGRAELLADETIDICVEAGTAAAEMLAAVFAARHARKSAEVAERAADSSLSVRAYRPYETALTAYREALRHEQSAALALRRLKDRLPHLRDLGSYASPTDETEVTVVGTHPPFRLVRTSASTHAAPPPDGEQE